MLIIMWRQENLFEIMLADSWQYAYYYVAPGKFIWNYAGR